LNTTAPYLDPTTASIWATRCSSLRAPSRP
jgi:hypothetical protein